MTRLVLFVLFLAAFVHAVWLIALRREPTARPEGRARTLFAFLTLYCMWSMGAPVMAGEEPWPTRPKAGDTAENDSDASFFRAMVDLWTALGYMARGDRLAYLGTSAEREAYVKAAAEVNALRAEYDGKVEEFKRLAQQAGAGSPEYRAMQADVVRLYEQHRFAQQRLTDLHNELDEAVGRQYAARFRKLMAEAAASGQVNPKAAALLTTVYDKFDSHFYRSRMTCYMATETSHVIKSRDTLPDVEKTIKKLAKAENPKDIDAKALDEVKARLIRDLDEMQNHAIETRLSSLQASDEEYIARAYAERCDRGELSAAADMLVDIAAELPENWGE